MLCAKEIVLPKMIGNLFAPLTLAANGTNDSITDACRDAMIFPHFRVGVFNANPPIPIRVLIKAPISPMFIWSFEMGQILETHTRVP